MFTTDEITHTTEDGRKFATINVDSSNLPCISVDTYQQFSGDGWAEMRLTDFEEQGYRRDEVEIRYDHGGILRDLAIAANDAVVDALWSTDPEQLVTVGDVTDTYSPRAYNFSTDSYSADYTIDLELMEEWIADRDWDHHDYGLEHFSSRSGFASFVPSWLEREDMAEGVRLWLFLHAYLAETLDPDTMLYAVAEVEWEAYDSNTTPVLDGREVEERLLEELSARTGYALVEDDGLIPSDVTESLTDSMAWDFDEYRAWLDEQLLSIIADNDLLDAGASEFDPSPWLGQHKKTMAKLA